MQKGMYRGVFQLHEGVELPINFEVKGDKEIVFINASERITATEIRMDADSLFIRMPMFDSEFKLKVKGDSLTGRWINYSRKINNILAFKARYNLKYRFAEKNEEAVDFGGKWEVDFSPGTADSSKAIGVFKKSGNIIEGTFLTNSGDYRYLEGSVQGGTLYLSCFDGIHAFLFKAEMQKDGSLKGMFWAGAHWQEKWVARRNDKYELPDANSLTFLKPGFDKIDFRFPDLDGKQVSLFDEKFRGKVVIVQIMGSWCPNCMDESGFLAGFYKKHQSKGLEIIGLAYERTPDFVKSRANLEKVKKRFDIGYTMLIAGTSDKGEAAKSLPMLNNVSCFPTTIIIDRKGKVRRIHTGYSGPATGKYYDEFVEDFTAFVDGLISEK